jgi:hypothetical protein
MLAVLELSDVTAGDGVPRAFGTGNAGETCPHATPLAPTMDAGCAALKR